MTAALSFLFKLTNITGAMINFSFILWAKKKSFGKNLTAGILHVSNIEKYYSGLGGQMFV